MTLRLKNVALATVDLRRAGLRCGRVRLASDREATVRLMVSDGSVRRVVVQAGTRNVRIAC